MNGRHESARVANRMDGTAQPWTLDYLQRQQDSKEGTERDELSCLANRQRHKSVKMARAVGIDEERQPLNLVCSLYVRNLLSVDGEYVAGPRPDIEATERSRRRHCNPMADARPKQGRNRARREVHSELVSFLSLGRESSREPRERQEALYSLSQAPLFACFCCCLFVPSPHHSLFQTSLLLGPRTCIRQLSRKQRSRPASSC
ncbi:hypothetical protein BD289DRAFT_150282 [Coniella lustricola]|uniref:Uncharacterized protein n=1 Tax=Coniella lustricola TaxID=2025994 RepID=A0A2T3AEV1_9PEZI|nr:hypothetical protein BD289DRAFT_150282 [Coniella lustricola]